MKKSRYDEEIDRLYKVFKRDMDDGEFTKKRFRIYMNPNHIVPRLISFIIEDNDKSNNKK